MASESEILREYLVSLGFRIDEPGQKKFDVGLGKLNMTAMGLGKTLLGVAVAAQTMVGIFATQMEKLYYSAKKADSTVANMQALEFGAKNIGISGDAMKSSLEGMARAMRSNPGLAGLLNSLGVEVKGRDKADVMLDLVTQLKKMPFAVAEQYASMFGIDSDQLFLMEEGLDKMKEAIAERKKMAAESGLDMDKAAEASLVYSRALTEMATRMDILYKMLSVQLLPSFLGFTVAINENLASMTKWLGQFKTLGDAWDSLMHPKKEEPAKPGEPKKKKTFWEWATTGPTTGTPYTPKNAVPPLRRGKLLPVDQGMGGHTTQHPNLNAPAAVPATQPQGKNASKDFSPEVQAKQAHLAALEVKYALPAGVLDALWSVESGRGKNKLSRTGAKGDMQFMDPTAKAYGVDVNSFDSSADGAARYLKDLMKRYDGDLLMALTGYSAGQTVLDKALGGKAHLKQENAEYGPKVMSRMPNGGIQQTNNITITGAGSPEDTAKMVGQAMDQANADLVRNNKLRVK